MTLVVARKNYQTKKITLVCDSRIFYDTSQTFEDALIQDSPDSIIKIMYSGNIAIAFAGDEALICQAVSSIINKSDIHEVKIKLLEHHNLAITNGKVIQFIVVEATADHLDSKLWEISAGELKSVDSAWLGNANAFNDFQRYIGQSDISSNLNKSMKDALSSVIQSRVHVDVGGLVFELIEGDGEFFFDTAFETSGFPLVYDSNSNDFKIGHGSSEIGTCSYETRELQDKKTLFYYYHQPRLLILYAKDSDKIYRLKLKKSFSTKEEAISEMSKYENGFFFCWN
jgi:hypothetical protein